jgi:HlyD family secretion protein
LNARSLSRPIRLALVGLVLVAVVAGGVALYRRSTGSQQAAATSGAPVPVQVTAAKTGPIRTVLTYSGAIQSSQQVSLAPRLAGQLSSIKVDVGTAVKQGDVLATLDQGTLPAQLQQAQASLASAQARLQLMLDGPRTADVAAAEAALAAAEAKLKQLLNPTPADLSAAESALRTAEVSLNNARVTVGTTKNALSAALSTYCNVFNAVHVKCESPLPIPTLQLELLQQHIASNSVYALSIGGTTGTALITANNAYVTAINNAGLAEVAFAAAQDKYGQVRNPSLTDVTAQRSIVEAARATLDNRKLPYTDADIAGARATVAAAQAGVATARTSLDQTSVISPFDGVVAQKLLDVGATVSPQTPVFVLVAKAVESHLTVDEARIGLIKPDMETEVSVPAYPNRTFKGKVATIAPLGDARAHTFDVKVFAEDREGLLKPGMFAQVSVIAATKANAILVPTAAIVQQGNVSRVFVVQNGKASAKTVKLGIADATNTEITEGVAAGDQVVTVGQNVLRDGQAVAIATPGAGGARPAGASGASGATGATGATGTSGAGAAPAGSGTPRAGGSGTPGASPTGEARPSGTVAP